MMGVGARRLGYALFLAAAVVAAYHWREPLLHVWREQGWTLVMAIGFMAASVILQARNFMTFIGPHAEVRLWSLSRVWALTSLANYLGPFQPGVALRIAYLSRAHVHWSVGVKATWRQLCASVWVALAGCGIGLLSFQSTYYQLLGGAFLAAFFTLPVLRAVLVRLLGKMKRPFWLASRRGLLIEALEGIHTAGIVGVAAQYMLSTVLLWLVYHAFGAPVGLEQALLITCLIYVSSLVALLPGNLGVIEAIYIIGGHGAGLTGPESAAMALLLRSAQILGAAILALAGTFEFLHRNAE